jgi:hypothetical protein
MPNRKVLDVLSGEFYLVNPDEIESSLANYTRPLYDPWMIEKLSLIEDLDSRSRFLVGDYPGERGYSSFTIKSFLYKDDFKALGNLKYHVTTGLPTYNITGKYEETEAGYIIYGFLTNPIKDGKECFMLYADKPAKEITASAAKSQNTTRTSTVKRNTVSSQKASTPSSKKQNTEKNLTLSKSDLSIIDSFVSLDSEAENKSSCYFLSYVLTNVGYNVQLLENKTHRPKLLLEYNNILSYVHVYTSSSANASWNVVVDTTQLDHLYVFCHIITSELYPDIYIFTGSDIVKSGKKNKAIKVSDIKLQKVKMTGLSF